MAPDLPGVAETTPALSDADRDAMNREISRLGINGCMTDMAGDIRVVFFAEPVPPVLDALAGADFELAPVQKVVINGHPELRIWSALLFSWKEGRGISPPDDPGDDLALVPDMGAGS